MPISPLEIELFEAIAAIPIVDVHSHINPRQPTARNLDELLSYHYFTELAHSAGMPKSCLAEDFDPQERCRLLLKHAVHYDNTVQFEWLTDISRIFLGFMGEGLQPADADRLWELAEKKMSQADWEAQVLRTTGVEQIFLTNDFDESLEGFDSNRYIPCLRTDDLVFRIQEPAIRERLAKVSQHEAADSRSLRAALAERFDTFLKSGARACAISLPPHFEPQPVSDADLDAALRADPNDVTAAHTRARGIFWRLAELCQEHHLPFDLMIGVNRRVYRGGVYQGQDLFDQRTSLIQYAELFNAFPNVTFCVSVLASGQNQELASYSWIFPNVVCSGHWWYSNLPRFIEADCQARLQAVPKVKQIGYYSDAYKLEFILPKFNMYRHTLARLLARDYMESRGWTQTQALELARQLLRENARRIFRLP